MNNKLQKLIGHKIDRLEPIIDAKGRPTGKVFIVFSNNYKLKVNQ